MFKILLPFSILIAFATACDSDSSSEEPNDVDCSLLTYQNFGEPFLADYCLGCHSSSAANRNGAPGAVNFDTLEEVRTRSIRMNARAGIGMTMPPVNGPSPQEREDLSQWIGCGNP
ncbi:MAG: hypothetical protein JKY56_26765 [Kofleriaceae bacterium]|nr:hypothetical protein [Kofleriaceae bacterium]